MSRSKLYEYIDELDKEMHRRGWLLDTKRTVGSSVEGYEIRAYKNIRLMKCVHISRTVAEIELYDGSMKDYCEDVVKRLFKSVEDI